jgi:hypothetical protein
MLKEDMNTVSKKGAEFSTPSKEELLTKIQEKINQANEQEKIKYQRMLDLMEGDEQVFDALVGDFQKENKSEKGFGAENLISFFEKKISETIQERQEAGLVGNEEEPKTEKEINKKIEDLVKFSNKTGEQIESIAQIKDAEIEGILKEVKRSIAETPAKNSAYPEEINEKLEKIKADLKVAENYLEKVLKERAGQEVA